MTKLVLNGSATNIFIINTYSRNTSFDGSTMNSYIYIGMGNNVDVAKLNAIGMSGITAITLLNENDEPFYSLNNVIGHITSIDESLSENNIFINMNIRIEA